MVGVPRSFARVGIAFTTACTNGSSSATVFSTSTRSTTPSPLTAASASALTDITTLSCLWDIFKLSEFTERVSVNAPSCTLASSSCSIRSTRSFIRHFAAAFFNSRACVSRDRFKVCSNSFAVSSASFSASSPAVDKADARLATLRSLWSISWARADICFDATSAASACSCRNVTSNL